MTTSRFLRVTSFAVLMGALIGGTSLATLPAIAADAPAASSTPAKPQKMLKSAVDPKAVYAKVEGENVTGQDVLDFIGKMPPQLQEQAPAALLEPIVNQMVNDRLVAKAAAAEKLDQDPKTKKLIDDAREQIIRDRFVERTLEAKITEPAIRAQFDQNVKNTPAQDEIRASHILVKDEKTANDVMDKLKKGGDFTALAKQYSIDPTKANGGDLGYFTQAAMVKEFGDAVFAMKKGDVSKTPIKTQFGYHIVKVIDRRPFKPNFEKEHDRIRSQMMEKEIQDIVKGLRDKAKVEITLPAA